MGSQKAMEAGSHGAGAELRDPRHGASDITWRGRRPREEKRWLRPCNSQPSGQVGAGGRLPDGPPRPFSSSPSSCVHVPSLCLENGSSSAAPALASGLEARPCAAHLHTGRLCLQSLPEKHSWHGGSMPDSQGQTLLQVKSGWVGGNLGVKGWDDSEQTTPGAGQAPSRAHLPRRGGCLLLLFLEWS